MQAHPALGLSSVPFSTPSVNRKTKVFRFPLSVFRFLLSLQKEKCFGARDREFRENREYKEFSDAPIPKFTHFSKLTNFTKKTIREIATSLSALAMTIHMLL